MTKTNEPRGCRESRVPRPRNPQSGAGAAGPHNVPGGTMKVALGVTITLCLCAMLLPGCKKDSQTLAIGTPLSGLTIFDQDSAPRRDGYIFLHDGEAVRLPGRPLDDARDLFYLSGEAIRVLDSAQYTASGFEVVANGSLKYLISIHDFEFEVKLPRVELTLSGDSIRSTFFFVADPRHPGVAHSIVIHTCLDGTPVDSTAPEWIEVR